MEKRQTNKDKKRGTTVRWMAAAAVVALLAALPLLAEQKDAENDRQASIRSVSAQYQNIDLQVVGGGQLSSEAALRLKIPEEVKLTSYLVGNGDTVSEGEPIASVDRVSVMSAITGVQKTLDYLSGKIVSAGNQSTLNTIKAQTGGRVKAIYAQKGEAVQDVMLEHGALAVLSLDDTMSVALEGTIQLKPGAAVSVTLPDGTCVDGRVTSNAGGVLTATIDDNGYAIGTPVTVCSKNGELLGSGELFISSPWNATAYAGTVSNIFIHEGAVIYEGQSLITVEDAGKSAEYQHLIDQRQEYEMLMQELFQMYRMEAVTAPCDGIVTGVDKNGAFLLSGEEESWMLQLLSSLWGKEKEGFSVCPVQVSGVNDTGLELRLNPRERTVSDLASVSELPINPEDMTQSWSCSADATVYIQREDGLLQAAGSAEVGDILLAVGDREQLHWLVVPRNGGNAPIDADTPTAQLLSVQDPEEPTAPTAPTAASAMQEPAPTVPQTTPPAAEPAPTVPQTTPPAAEPAPTVPETTPPAQKPEQTSEAQPILNTVPLMGAGERFLELWQSNPECTEDENCTAAVHKDGCPRKKPAGDSCTGEEDCTAQIHNPDCKARCTGRPDCPAIRHKEGCLSQQQPAEDVYLVYAAMVEAVVDGTLQVKQNPKAYTITDLENLLSISTDTSAMTEAASYAIGQTEAAGFAQGDIVLIVLDADGAPVMIRKIGTSGGAQTPDEGAPGGGKSGMGAMGGGTGQTQTFTLYSLEKLTVASVTSQEHMTLTVTVDELDISKIYPGQSANVVVDALAGEHFAASVSSISNCGTNEGGNSKFTVELTLEKSGQMLPGMRACASIRLRTEEHALCVPVSALAEENGKTVLYTGYDAQSKTLYNPVPVTIGVADADKVQILQGLTQGQTVYYTYYDNPSEVTQP